jgi:sporulation protein YlmC with PRC-barrel domain
MSKELLGAVSAVALLAGVAAAQDAGPGAPPTPTPPATTTTPPAEASPRAPATPATAGEAVRAADMIGRSVQGSDGKPLGKVKDAVVDAQSGKIQKLVIASGGFLGLGAKNVALDFDRLEVRPEGGIVAKDVTQKDVEAMPRYDVAAETKPLDKPPPPAAAAPGTTGVGGVGAGGGGAVVPPPRPAQQ